MKRSKTWALVAALAVMSFGCDNPFAPDEAPPPPGVNVTVNVEQNVNTLPMTPAPSPTPAPGSQDKTIVALTVTESGGNGERSYVEGERFVLTATPRNADGEDPCELFATLSACGAYTEADIRWEPVSGVTNDDSGVVRALGVGGTNYNYDFKALKSGTFTVRAVFRGTIRAEFTGTVK